MINQYLQAMKWGERHLGVRPEEITDNLEFPERRVRSWYKGNKPRVMQKVETADNYGWFDATWDSNIGQEFNSIITGVFSDDYLKPFGQVSITLNERVDSQTEERLRLALQTLIGSSKRSHDDYPNQASQLCPGVDQSLLARAFTALGAPTGRKNKESNINISEFLSIAPDMIRREFVVPYVVLRGTRRDDGAVDIVEERPQSYLDSLRELIVDVTGETVTVRTNRLFLKKATAERLPTLITWDCGESNSESNTSQTARAANAASLLRNAVR
jgi:hypothetical protein